MELLGTKNNEQNITEQLISINRTILSGSNISSVSGDLIYILNAIANSNQKEALFNAEVIAALFMLDADENIASVPIIKNLVTELKLKLIRTQCLNTDSVSPLSLSGSCCGSDENIPESLVEIMKLPEGSHGIIDNGRERFVASPDTDFQLPPKGDVWNLIARGTDYETNRILRREVMIDHEGYVMRELSREWEGEEESIYADSFLDDIKAKKDEAKMTKPDKADTIKEAEDTCNTGGDAAPETGVK